MCKSVNACLLSTFAFCVLHFDLVQKMGGFNVRSQVKKANSFQHVLFWFFVMLNGQFIARHFAAQSFRLAFFPNSR